VGNSKAAIRGRHTCVFKYLQNEKSIKVTIFLFYLKKKIYNIRKNLSKYYRFIDFSGIEIEYWMYPWGPVMAIWRSRPNSLKLSVFAEIFCADHSRNKFVRI
jgi:hypothetical protein